MNTLLCPIWRCARHGRRDRAADGGRSGGGVSRLIRHAGCEPPLAIVPLPITVIEPAVWVLLVASGGLAPLHATCLEATPLRAVPLPTVAGPADIERGTALRSGAKPLIEDDLCGLCHSVPAAGLDRTGRSWQGDLHVGTWRSFAGPTHTTPVARTAGVFFRRLGENDTPFPPDPPPAPAARMMMVATLPARVQETPIVGDR